MKLFKDAVGREWLIDVNAYSIECVKSITGVNLLSILEGELAQKLSMDAALLCNVVYAICKEQADEKGVTAADFGRSMKGDAIADATDALLGDIVNFFPSAKRAVLTKMLEKLGAIQTLAINVAMDKLNSGEIEQEVKRMLDSSNSSSGSVPASAALTPAG